MADRLSTPLQQAIRCSQDATAITTEGALNAGQRPYPAQGKMPAPDVAVNEVKDPRRTH